MVFSHTGLLEGQRSIATDNAKGTGRPYFRPVADLPQCGTDMLQLGAFPD
jgi:hypothetical protein